MPHLRSERGQRIDAGGPASAAHVGTEATAMTTAADPCGQRGCGRGGNLSRRSIRRLIRTTATIVTADDGLKFRPPDWPALYPRWSRRRSDLGVRY